MLSFKLIILLSCSVLWRLGGWDKAKWSGYRDTLIPIILGFSLAIITNSLVALICCGTYFIIRLGYGSYDPINDDKPSFLASITKDTKGYWIRAIYGLICSCVGALPLFYYGHLIILNYIVYMTANTIIGFLVSYCKLPDIPTELIVGLGFGSILFLI